MSDTRTTSTFRGLGWAASSGSAYYLVSLATIPIVSRLLAPRDFGVVAAGLLLVGMFAVVIDLGMGPAIVHAEDMDATHASSALILSTALGVGYWLLLVIFSPQLASFFSMPELQQVLCVVGSTLVPLAWEAIGRSILERGLRFRTVAVARPLFDGLLYAVLAVGLAVLLRSYWALVIAHTVARTATGLYFILKIPSRYIFHRPSLSLLRSLGRFGSGITAIRIASYVAREADTFFVSRAFSAAALGIYNRAYKLMTIPAQVGSAALESVVFPTLTRTHRDSRSLAEPLSRGLVGIAVLTVPTASIVIVVAPQLVVLVLGNQWVDVIVPLRILIVGLFFRLGYKLAGIALNALGLVGVHAKAHASFAALGIGLMWLGSNWGLAGVAVAVVVLLICQFSLLWTLLTRHGALRGSQVFSPIVRPWLVGLGLFCVAMGARLAFDHLIPVEPLVSGLAVVTTITAYAGVLLTRPEWVFGADSGWWVRQFLAAKNRITR